MILIGSRAASLRMNIGRKNIDFDWVCTMDEYYDWVKNNSHKVNPTKMYAIEGKNKMIIEGSTNCEFEIVMPGTSSEMLYNIVRSSPSTIKTSFGLIPDLDMLFTIKSSHKYLKNSPFFWKTLIDIHRMKAAGAKVRHEYQDFLKMREEETYFNQQHPKLNTDKKNFFSNNGIEQKFVHDDIHISVAKYDRPAYLNYMKDGESVMCDMNKFFKCSREIQLAGVYEEAAVLGLERSKIVFGDVMSDKQAFTFALSKVASSITSGKFREFAYNNIFDVIKLYDPNYVKKFWADVESGKVRYMSNYEGQSQ